MRKLIFDCSKCCGRIVVEIEGVQAVVICPHCGHNNKIQLLEEKSK